MRVLIDGYNLAHVAWPAHGRSLRGRAWPRFRQRLIDRLRHHHTSEEASVTVVFDAAQAPRDATADQEIDGIHVRFAVGYPAADDLIEELIRAETAPAGLTVVSDDRRLRTAARRRGCLIRGCLDYLQSSATPEPKEPAPDVSGKPDAIPPADVDHWLREFGRLDD